MVNGKIKEWHMDDALLARLATGGSIDISSLLSDYVKKTDIIDLSQLDPTVLNGIRSDIENLENAVANCRNNDTPITRNDIDEAFQNVLNNLQNQIDTLSSGNIDTEELQRILYESLESQIDGKIAEVVNTTVPNTVDARLNDKIDELIAGAPDSRLVDAIDDSVSEALHNGSYVSDLRAEILSTIGEEYASVQRVNELEYDVEREIEAIENRQNGFDTSLSNLRTDLRNHYRNKDTAIQISDLDSALAEQIGRVLNMATDIQNDNFARKVIGQPGQNVRLDLTGEMIAADLIAKKDVAANAAELADLKAQLLPEIYDAESLKRYFIGRRPWNYLADIGYHVDEEEIESSIYADYTLTAANLITDGITVTVNNGTIAGTNTSLIDKASVTFGFYGTRARLYITIPESTTQAGAPVRQYYVRVDDLEQREVLLYSGDTHENECFFYVEDLSEGPHRVTITVLPGAEFNIDTKISLDAEHAVLLPAEHIKPSSFYEGPIYDTGDYMTDAAYNSIKSNNVSVVSSAEYLVEDVEPDTLNGELFYSEQNQILFYGIGGDLMPVANMPKDLTDPEVETIWNANIS